MCSLARAQVTGLGAPHHKQQERCNGQSVQQCRHGPNTDAVFGLADTLVTPMLQVLDSVLADTSLAVMCRRWTAPQARRKAWGHLKKRAWLAPARPPLLRPPGARAPASWRASTGRVRPRQRARRAWRTSAAGRPPASGAAAPPSRHRQRASRECAVRHRRPRRCTRWPAGPLRRAAGAPTAGRAQRTTALRAHPCAAHRARRQQSGAARPPAARRLQLPTPRRACRPAWILTARRAARGACQSDPRSAVRAMRACPAARGAW